MEDFASIYYIEQTDDNGSVWFEVRGGDWHGGSSSIALIATAELADDIVTTLLLVNGVSKEVQDVIVSKGGLEMLLECARDAMDSVNAGKNSDMTTELKSMFVAIDEIGERGDSRGG